MAVLRLPVRFQPPHRLAVYRPPVPDRYQFILNQQHAAIVCRDIRLDENTIGQTLEKTRLGYGVNPNNAMYFRDAGINRSLGDVTLFALAVTDATTGNNTIISLQEDTTSTNKPELFFLDCESGTMRIGMRAVSGSTFYQAALSSQTTGELASWVGRRSGSLLELFKNGVFQSADSVSTDTILFEDAYIGAFHGGSLGISADYNEAILTCGWEPRAWSDAEIMAWARNPWKDFYFPQVIPPEQVAAAGGGLHPSSLSLLGVGR